MTDGEHTTPADRRGLETERIGARIEELEREQERIRERIKKLRARKVRETGVETEPDGGRADAPRDVLLGHLDRITDEEDLDGVDEGRLLAAATDEGVSPSAADDALDRLKRTGEVYVVGGEVRQI